MSCDDMCACEKFGIDYYGVLGIKKDSNDLEIKKAFRRLAINCNPGRKENRLCRAGSSLVATFSLVAEAYDVLSDPLKRAVYDQYGEEGLKRGAPGPQAYLQPYVYHGEPMRTYREFFGTESPYADLLDSLLEKPADSGGGGGGGRRTGRSKEEALVQPLPLTLSEVFFGGIKKMKIQRLAFANAEKTETALGETVLTIPIAPGIPAGTEIVFTEAGDQGPSKIPADIVFVTEDRPHETFKRVEGTADLSMTARIFLREALVGTVVTVNTLDERTLRVPVTSIVTPGYEKLVTGEGLPVPNDPELRQRGNLVIKFDVEFPVYLPLDSKIYVKKAFKARRTDAGDRRLRHDRRSVGKLRRNVDEDIPLRRNRDDEFEKLKLLCTN